MQTDATNANIVGELTSFKLCATTPNNTQQHGTGPGVQMDATCNIQQCWELLANNVASVFLGLWASLQCQLNLRPFNPPPNHPSRALTTSLAQQPAHLRKMQKPSYLSKGFSVGHSNGNGARNLLVLKSTFNQLYFTTLK